MRRANLVVSVVLAVTLGLTAGGCGGSSAVTGPDAPGVAVAGASVLHGAVLAPGIGSASPAAGVSADSVAGAWTVGVVGSAQSSPLDQDGRFVLSGLPAGSVTLKIEGPGVSAQLLLSGLVDGQVLSVEIQVTGGSAHVTGAPKCTPSAETFFSGTLDQAAGSQLVIGGRKVDASRISKVWRGERRIQLSELELGEKVKVWGTLRGDAVVVADEIAALTTGHEGGDSWVTFTGRVDSVSGKGFQPNPAPAYPVLVVKGLTVKTDASTHVKRSDGQPCAAGEIQAGQTAYVEGWKKPEGYVRATLIVIG